MKTVSFGLTDVGKKRNHNEDSFFVDDSSGLYVVADGMGGHAAGEVASGTAISVVCDFVGRVLTGKHVTWPEDVEATPDLKQSVLPAAVHLANHRICRLSEEVDGYSGMGTTLSAMLVNSSGAHIAHVGDSRIYMLRAGELHLVTTDHSWVQEQLERGVLTLEEARTHRWRNVITRALGNREELEVDAIEHELQVGDIYLFSDSVAPLQPRARFGKHLRIETPFAPEIGTTWRIKVMADSVGEVAEVDETDNVGAGAAFTFVAQP